MEFKDKFSEIIVLGCVYQNYSPISDFNENYFEEALKNFSKDKNKIFALMGDFNVDLVKVQTHSETCDFCDLLSSNGFRSLILQWTIQLTDTLISEQLQLVFVARIDDFL